jgi:hypothetical protein
MSTLTIKDNLYNSKKYFMIYYYKLNTFPLVICEKISSDCSMSLPTRGVRSLRLSNLRKGHRMGDQKLFKAFPFEKA